MKKQVVSSSFYKTIEVACLFASSMFLTPYLVTHLGMEDYGLWVLALSVISWLFILEFGFPEALQREVAIAMVKEDSTELQSLFSTSLLLFLALSVLAIFVVVLLVVTDVLALSEYSNAKIIKTCLLLLSLKLLYDFLFNSYHAFLMSILRLDIDHKLSTLNILLKTIAMFILIPKLGLWGALIASLGADFISNTIKILWIKNAFPALSFNILLANRQKLNHLFHFAKHVWLDIVARTLNLKSMPIVITKLLDVSLVGVYSVLNNLAVYVSSFIYALNDSLIPVFNKKFAQQEDLQSLFDLNVRVNIFCATLFYLPLVLLGESFVLLWLGSAFSEHIYILYFSAFVLLLKSISIPINQVLLAQAKHQLIARTNLFSAIVSIISAIFLGSHFGLKGIVFAASVSFLLFEFGVSLLLIKKFTGFAIASLCKTLAMAFFLILFFFLFFQYIQLNALIKTWGNLFFVSIGVFLANILPCYFLLLNQSLKQMLNKQIHRCLRAIY
ncbi:lipopolysaccharide biosynthesis protein [Thalassotalea aquiviva]|uniref:lipopolysaccharide biosynthesis protein n=1 Tax=Thalassotalea aquiviva TaxID=3242415 RepID=UPI00352A1EF4